MKTTYLCVVLTWVTLSSTFAFAQSSDGANLGSYGIALPKFQVTLRSSIDRRIAQIHVDEGSLVKRGDILVQLDCDDALAKQKIAELESIATGGIANAEAELEYAESHLERITQLLIRNASNEEEVEEARMRNKKAIARLTVEKERQLVNLAKFELAQAELQKFALRAPFDGQVTLVKATAGQSITPTDDLLKIVSLDSLRVEMFLPISTANQIQVGKNYPLNVRSPNERQVAGKAIFRAPVIEAATSTLRIVFEIDNRELNLPAGATLELGALEPTDVAVVSASK